MSRRGALLLRAGTVLGLATDAAIHVALAPRQPPGGPGQVDQPTLFYAEAAVAAAAAVVLLRTARRWAYLLAGVVAGTALAALLVSRYADTGAIWFVPNTYEPVWYPSKVGAALGEAAATVTAALGCVARLDSASVGRMGGTAESLEARSRGSDRQSRRRSRDSDLTVRRA